MSDRNTITLANMDVNDRAFYTGDLVTLADNNGQLYLAHIAGPTDREWSEAAGAGVPDLITDEHDAADRGVAL